VWLGYEDEAAALELARRERGFDAASWESVAIAQTDEDATSILQDVDARVAVHDLRGKLGVPGSGPIDAEQAALTTALEQLIVAGAASGEAALYGVTP
jgi:hypothetical protein